MALLSAVWGTDGGRGEEVNKRMMSYGQGIVLGSFLGALGLFRWGAILGIVLMLAGMALKIETTERRASIYGRFTVLHAKDGGPVLRGQSSWRTVCGVMMQGSRWRTIVSWKDHGG